MKFLYLVPLVFLVAYAPQSDSAATAPVTTTSDIKAATSATAKANQAIADALPFDNTESFELAKRGLIAALPEQALTDASGKVVIWDPNKYAFVNEGAAPDSVNPSLWRQSQLISISGLFKVNEHIYQVRNYDLSNITFIEGATGITVVDPLISAETAKAALELYYEHRPKKPVVAVIYTHSHVDHFGGVRGVVDEADVKSGKVRIFAPDKFADHAIAENVIAGNAMSRRAAYMYGNLLPPDVRGQVGAGLGTTTSAGTVTLILPTDIVARTGEQHQIDGYTYTFKMAPDSEAPSEMFFYIEELKALCTAEDATHTLHNTYSLRGAKIRNPLVWSKYLNWAIDEWGDADVLFAPHHWPVWGSDAMVNHLKAQRDTYRYIHDQALRMANQGYTMVEIGEQIEMPPELAQNFSARGYYGSVNHDAKSAYVQYLGWFDGNPASLHRLPPADAAKRYVEFMGGADNVLAKAQQSFDAGDYRWVAEVVNHVVFADPSNQDAKNLQADALEQLGYQAESGPWRNFYLSGAQELRNGLLNVAAPNTASPDIIRAMNLDLLFDFLGVRLDGPKAFGENITLNIRFTDIDEDWVLFLENAALSHSKGRRDEADATVTLTKAKLNEVLLGETKLEQAIEAGDVTIAGDQQALTRLLDLLVDFEFWFNIVTP